MRESIVEIIGKIHILKDAIVHAYKWNQEETFNFEYIKYCNVSKI